MLFNVLDSRCARSRIISSQVGIRQSELINRATCCAASEMPCHLGGSAAEGKHGQERKRDTSTLLGCFTSFQKRVVKSRIALALSREETRREGCVILTAGGRFESVVLTTAGQPGCQQRRPRIGAAPSKLASDCGNTTSSCEYLEGFGQAVRERISRISSYHNA